MLTEAGQLKPISQDLEECLGMNGMINVRRT